MSRLDEIRKKLKSSSIKEKEETYSRLDEARERVNNYKNNLAEINRLQSAANYPRYEDQVSALKNTNQNIVSAKPTSYFDDGYQFGDVTKTVGRTLTSFVKNFGADTLDSAVDTAEGLKTGFKSQMVQDELKAWNSLAFWQSGEYKKNKRWANFSQDLVNSYIQSAKDTLKHYNVSVPQNVTPEYARQKAKELESWVNQESSLAKYTENLSQQVHASNEQLSSIEKYIANAGGVVGRMIPSIASNAIIPRLWFANDDIRCDAII